MSSEHTVVLLKQIILSPSIIKAISDYTIRPLEIQNIVEEDGSFPLSRMKRMMEASTNDFDKLVSTEVIQVRRKKSPLGKNQGKNIDGTMRQLYVIANGRHRIARAIIEGIPEIIVEILN
jgi:hypothetical protein